MAGRATRHSKITGLRLGRCVCATVVVLALVVSGDSGKWGGKLDPATAIKPRGNLSSPSLIHGGASGRAAAANWPSAQIVFLVELSPYDGVFDPSNPLEYGLDPCLALNQTHPCGESNGAPFVFRYASTIARGIVAAHPETALSFAVVHYGAFSCDNFGDCDGDAVYADVPDFVSAPNLSAALNRSPAAASIMNGSYPDSDMNSSLLHSDSITALYGVLAGGLVNWSAEAHHVVVQIGSTAPRAPGYTQNYSVSASVFAENRSTAYWLSPSCEPGYLFASGGSSPNCEGWLVNQDGNQSHSVARLARNADACTSSIGGNCTVDEIDLRTTASDASSSGWPAQFAGIGGGANGTVVKTDVARVLSAGCGMANATGGTWDGPSSFVCGSTQGTLQFEGWNASFDQSRSLYASLVAVGLGNASQVSAYPLAFHEAGLPAGANWSVAVAGVNMASTSPWIVIPEWNGTYSYQVNPIAGFSLATGSGTVVVHGGNTTVAVTFEQVTYAVTFAEVGLPNATAWGLSVDGNTSTGVAAIQLWLSNGSYTFEVDSPTGFTASPPSGTFLVNGSARGLQVSFAAKASVPPLSANVSVRHLYESCLADGGVTNTVELTANVSGGTPPYTIQWTLPTGADSGSTVNATFTYGGNDSGLLVVNDSAGGSVRKSVVVSLLLPPCPPPPRQLGSSNASSPFLPWWIIGGIAAAALGVAGAVYFARRGRSGTRSSLRDPAESSS